MSVAATEDQIAQKAETRQDQPTDEAPGMVSLSDKAAEKVNEIRGEEKRLFTALNNCKRIEERYEAKDISSMTADDRKVYRDQRNQVLSQDALVKMLQEQHTVLQHQLNGAGEGS